MRIVAFLLLALAVTSVSADVPPTARSADSNPAIESALSGKKLAHLGETSATPIFVRPAQTDDEKKDVQKRESQLDRRETENADASSLSAQQSVRQADAAWLQVWISAIGTLIAIIGGIYIMRTFQETKRTADASRDAADAAIRAISADRAWMVYSEITVGAFTDGQINGVLEKNGILIFVTWKNAGRSPAVNALAHIQHRIVEFNSVDVPAFSEAIDDRLNSVPIGPDCTVNTVQRGIGEQESARVFNRTSAVIVYSKIVYRDTFNNSVVHASEVCFKVSFNGEQQTTDGRKINWIIMPVGTQNTAS